MVLKIKKQIQIMKDKEYDFNPQKKWVSVESLLDFVNNYDYYDYLVEALHEELEKEE